MGKVLRIVQGNTFGTAIEINAVDAEGHAVQDFSLDGSTSVRVWYVFAGKEVDVEAWSIDDGKVVILWDGRSEAMRLGTYDIFIEGMFEETAWRNAMKSQFTLVKYNYEAYIPDDVIVLDGIYQLTAQMSLITRVSGGGGGTPSQTIPLMDGEASVGEETAYARGDHRHPTDTTRQAVINDLDAIRAGSQAGATAYQKPSGGIPKTDLTSGVQSSLGLADTAIQPAAISDMATETYVDGKVGDEATRAQSAEGLLQGAIDAIEAVIPSAASSSNQLADKAFVNSSISTNTANFIGTFNSLAELQQRTATNNDYAFVIEVDALGNEYYDRYKYNGSQWLYEYKVESTPFTASQWAAIQSGITSALVTKIGTALQPTDIIDSLSSASTTSALSANQGKVLNEGKQDKIDNSHKLSADLVDDASTTNKFVTSSEKSTWNGKADKVLVVNHGTSDTTYTLPPNELHIWGTVASLAITLGTPTDATIENEYKIQFTSGSTATQFSLPQGVEWGTQDPEQPNPLVVKANAIYQISIINNIGLWAAISNS